MASGFFLMRSCIFSYFMIHNGLAYGPSSQSRSRPSPPTQPPNSTDILGEETGWFRVIR